MKIKIATQTYIDGILTISSVYESDECELKLSVTPIMKGKE